MSNPDAMLVFRGKIIAASITASILIYIVISVVWVSVLKQSPILTTDDTRMILGVVFLVMALTTASGSLTLRKIMVARLTPENDGPQVRIKITIILLAISESSAILGLVYAILTSTLDYPWLLFAISLANALYHFPSTAWLQGPDQSE